MCTNQPANTNQKSLIFLIQVQKSKVDYTLKKENKSHGYGLFPFI